MTAKLERWTGWLLVFLALGAFVLSFAGMYAVAVDAGYGWLAWLWPLVTESAVVIFSLILLNAKLDGYVNKYLHPMIVGCTALSVTFNIWHAPSDDLLTRSVVALPPIFLYAAFKVWIWKVEMDTKRQGLVVSLDNLRQERDKVTKERDSLTAELSDLRQEHDRLTKERDKVTGELSDLRQERDSLTTERDSLTGQIDKLTTELDSLQRDKLTTDNQSVAEIDVARQARQDKTSDRKRQAKALAAEGLTLDDIAETLDVSQRTVQRYLNGNGVQK